MSAPHPLDGSPMDPASVPAEPLPTLPGFPYLHRGAAAVIVGPTGGGRSSLVQAGAYDAARADLRVAYLGSEITPAEFNARAADLAVRRGDNVDDDLRAELARVRYLDLAGVIARAWEVPQAWVDEAIKRFDVVARARGHRGDLDQEQRGWLALSLPRLDEPRWHHGTPPAPHPRRLLVAVPPAVPVDLDYAATLRTFESLIENALDEHRAGGPIAHAVDAPALEPDGVTLEQLAAIAAEHDQQRCVAAHESWERELDAMPKAVITQRATAPAVPRCLCGSSSGCAPAAAAVSWPASSTRTSLATRGSPTTPCAAAHGSRSTSIRPRTPLPLGARPTPHDRPAADRR